MEYNPVEWEKAFNPEWAKRNSKAPEPESEAMQIIRELAVCRIPNGQTAIAHLAGLRARAQKILEKKK